MENARTIIISLFSLGKIIAVFMFLPGHASATEAYDCLIDGSVHSEVFHGTDKSGIDYGEFYLKTVSLRGKGSTTTEFCNEMLKDKLNESGLMKVRINKLSDVGFNEDDEIKLLWRLVEYGCPSGWCYLDGFSILDNVPRTYLKIA